MSTYVMNQAFPSERSRLDAQAAHWDPLTMQLIRSFGIGPGARCLEVGAGTGSVARLLAELVGPTGQVVAIDRDTRFLTDLPDNVDVYTLDVTTDPLPEGFDLVHARLLVEHLPPYRDTLRSLLTATGPGGWLLVQDIDWITAPLVFPEAPVHARVCAALTSAMRAHGYNPEFGRHLFEEMLSLDLLDAGAQLLGGQLRSDGAEAWAPWQLIVEQFQDRLVEYGLLSSSDVEQWWALSRDGQSICTSPLMFASWGRRP